MAKNLLLAISTIGLGGLLYYIGKSKKHIIQTNALSYNIHALAKSSQIYRFQKERFSEQQTLIICMASDIMTPGLGYSRYLHRVNFPVNNPDNREIIHGYFEDGCLIEHAGNIKLWKPDYGTVWEKPIPSGSIISFTNEDPIAIISISGEDHFTLIRLRDGVFFCLKELMKWALTIFQYDPYMKCLHVRNFNSIAKFPCDIDHLEGSYLQPQFFRRLSDPIPFVRAYLFPRHGKIYMSIFLIILSINSCFRTEIWLLRVANACIIQDNQGVELKR